MLYITPTSILYSSPFFSDKNEQRLMTEWNVWKNKFGKMYQTMEEEVERYFASVYSLI